MNKLKDIIQELFGKNKSETKVPNTDNISTDDSIKKAFDEIRNCSAAKNARLRETLNNIANKKRDDTERIYKIINKSNNRYNKNFKKGEYRNSVITQWNIDRTWTSTPYETDEEKVIKILKGDFEKKFGMSFEKFIDIYNNIINTSPEKLI